MKKIINYLFLVLWLFLIFYLSHQPGSVSGSISGSLIYQTLEKIFNLFNIQTNNLIDIVSILHEPLRELMHSLEFLILAILFINAIKDSKIKSIFLVTIMFTFIYAASDEVHQLFVINRSFQYFDILMDMIGSITGALIGIKIFKLKSN